MAAILNLTITMVGSDIAYCRVVGGDRNEITKVYSSQSGQRVSVENKYTGLEIYIQPCDSSGKFVSATWSNYSIGTPGSNSTIKLPAQDIDTPLTFLGTITSGSSSSGGGDSGEPGGGGSSITSSTISIVFDEGVEYVEVYIDDQLKITTRASNSQHTYPPPSRYILFKATIKNGYNFNTSYLQTNSSPISSLNDTLQTSLISSYYNATFNTTKPGSGGSSSGGIDYGFYVGGKFYRIYIYDDNDVRRQVAIKVNGKYLGRKT